MNGSLKEIQENAIKKVKKINETVQDLKVEIEAMQESPIEYRRWKRRSQA